MLIRQTRVRELTAHLGALVPRTHFRLAVETAHVGAGKLNSSGFASLNSGDTLLPGVVGRISRFNADGRFDVDRTQPKTSRFMGTRTWTRREWAGSGQTREVTTDVDIYRECYPRTFVPPPALELTVVDHLGTRLIVSEPVEWGVTPAADVLHAINLFLELFGECEVRHTNLTALTPPNSRRVNWTMLPPGPQSLQAVTAHVQQVINRAAPSFRGPIHGRLSFMAGRNPDEVWIGNGGFRSYVAYVFNGKGTAVLESVMPDNATYVFGANWQTVSRLSKADVLSAQHHIARIFHDRRWQARVLPHT